MFLYLRRGCRAAVVACRVPCKRSLSPICSRNMVYILWWSIYIYMVYICIYIWSIYLYIYIWSVYIWSIYIYILWWSIYLWWSKCLKVMHHNWSKVQAGWKPGVLNLQAIWESKVVGPLKKDGLHLYSRLASEIICPSSLPPHKSYIQVPHTWPNYLLLSITAVTCNVTASYCITCSYSIISTIGLFWYHLSFLPRSLTSLLCIGPWM